MFPQWLEPAQLDDTIWFRLSTSGAEARLVPQVSYLWLDQPLN
jgi:hypothetical protein